jgi:hypothetical protein
LEWINMAQIQAAEADQSGRRPATERDTLKDRRSSTRPLPKNSQALSGDGLELIRSSDC